MSGTRDADTRASVSDTRVILLGASNMPAAWAHVARATIVPLAALATEGADGVHALTEAECVLLDADGPDPLAAARVAHRLDPEVQVVAVAATEARRRVLQRALSFTAGVGELWVASPEELAGGIAERAAGVTRQRRKFRRTRERIERERIESSPQRSLRAQISDEYLANLLQVLPDPVFSVDAAGRVLSANPAAIRILHSGESGLVGDAIDEVLGVTNVSVRAMLAAVGKRPSSATITFRRAEGASGHGELYVAHIAGSEPALYAVVLHDLTERHEAQLEEEAQTEELHMTIAALEERTLEAERAREELAESDRQFRTLADAIPTLAWTARPDGFIDWYNARWYEYTGTTPEEMEGWGWQRVHDAALLSSVMEQWQRSLDTGIPFEMTFPLRAADGSFRAFLTRVVPVRSADGMVVRWFGTNTDVEVERAARAAAERERETATEANRAKSEFLSTMSHELRTPLNAIQGYADLLVMGVRGAINPEQLEDLQRIRRANNHLMSLITDILNFARLEAGKVELHLAAVELAPLMNDVESLVMPQLAIKGLTFDREGCAEGAPAGSPIVRADPEKLRQVLLNLLTNAIKFTAAGGRVAVSCETDAAASVVRVSVADTGRGIPAEQLERVFEPFVQVDRHRTQESQQGVGLGLAISRDLVGGMNGDLGVVSEVGVGSTFTITLPQG